MSHGLLDFPTGAHVDAWVVILSTAAAATAGTAATWGWRLQHRWRHHPYRMTVEGHVVHAMWAAGIILGIAAMAHGLGWPAWGAPLLCAIGLGLVMATLAARRFAFLPQLRAYERNAPELIEPRAPLPRAAVRPAIFPWIVGMIGAPVAYLSFTWHRWNHVYHEGMYLLGFVIVFGVASLVATQLEEVARFERDIRRSRGARRRTRR